MFRSSRYPKDFGRPYLSQTLWGLTKDARYFYVLGHVRYWLPGSLTWRGTPCGNAPHPVRYRHTLFSCQFYVCTEGSEPVTRPFPLRASVSAPEAWLPAASRSLVIRGTGPPLRCGDRENNEPRSVLCQVGERVFPKLGSDQRERSLYRPGSACPPARQTGLTCSEHRDSAGCIVIRVDA